MRVVCTSELRDKAIVVYDYLPYNCKMPNHRLYIRSNKDSYEVVREYYFTKNPVTIISVDNGYEAKHDYTPNREEVIYQNINFDHAIVFANNEACKIFNIHPLAPCQHREPFKSINCKY